MGSMIHLSFISAIINAIGDFFSNLIMGLVSGIANLVLSIIYTLFFGSFCTIINACQAIFRIFAGTDKVIYTEAGQNIFGSNNMFGGSSGNMLFDFLMSATIMDIFFKILILSIFLLIIFTIVAIIKQEYSTDVTKPENNKSAILAKSGRALMSFVFIPIMCIFGIYASNQLLIAIDGATGGGSANMGSRIFVASSFNANRARIDEDFFNALCNKDSAYNLSNTFNEGNKLYFGVNYTGSDVGKAMDVVATKVDNAFLAEAELPGEWKHNDDFGTGLRHYIPLNIFPAGDTFNCANFEVAFYYYDLWKFEYVVGIISAIVLAFLYIKLLITLAKRIYEIILLFLASPAVIAMMPLDGGEALKKWRGSFVGKVLMIYCPVAAMNLFISIFGLFTSVDSLSTIMVAMLGLTEGDPLYGALAMSTGGASSGIMLAAAASFLLKQVPGLWLAYNIILCLFMCAGVMVVDQASKWLSEWIGAEDATASAKQQGGTAAKMMARGVMAPALAAGKFVAAKNAISGSAKKVAAQRKANKALKANKASEKAMKKDITSRMKPQLKQFQGFVNQANQAERQAESDLNRMRNNKEYNDVDYDQIDERYDQLIKEGKSESEASTILQQEVKSKKIRTGNGKNASEHVTKYVKGLELKATAKKTTAKAKQDYKNAKNTWSDMLAENKAFHQVKAYNIKDGISNENLSLKNYQSKVKNDGDNSNGDGNKSGGGHVQNNKSEELQGPQNWREVAKKLKDEHKEAKQTQQLETLKALQEKDKALKEDIGKSDPNKHSK